MFFLRDRKSYISRKASQLSSNTIYYTSCLPRFGEVLPIEGPIARGSPTKELFAPESKQVHCAPQGSSDAAWKMKPQGTSLPRHRGGTVWDPDRYNTASIPLGFLLGLGY